MRGGDYGFVGLFNKIDNQLVKEAEGDWKKTEKVSFFRSRQVKAACAVICVSFGAFCIFQPQVHAAIKEFTGWMSRFWNTGKDLSPYTEVINKQQEKDGFTLCLDEVILSDNKIYAAVTIDTEYPEGSMKGEGYVTINGTDYFAGSVYDQSEDAGQKLGEQVPHHLYTFVLDGELPETVTDMGLHFTAYQNYEDLLQEKNGTEFDFAFSATKEELIKNKIQAPVDKTITLEDGTVIRLKKLTLTEIDSRIEAELENVPEKEGDEEYTFYDWYLEGRDSLGNPVWYYGDISDGKEITFISDIKGDGPLPSMDSEWIELQFYLYEAVDEEDWQPIDTVDGEDVVMSNDDSPRNRVNVGEPFRIDIS